jgi:hypothetical protein
VSWLWDKDNFIRNMRRPTDKNFGMNIKVKPPRSQEFFHKVNWFYFSGDLIGIIE